MNLLKKKYYLTFDTETTNSLDYPLVYDLGIAVHNRKGKVYETCSLVIKEIFCNEELMSSAYFADKIPQYREDIANGTRKVVSLYEAKKIMSDLCEKYNIKVLIAHNIKFDVLALETTQRYLTKSKYRYFLPKNKVLLDTQVLVRNTIAKTKEYKDFCNENQYLTATYKRPQITAEVVHRYLTKNNDFVESHTGLEDVLIEKDIFCKLNKWGIFTKPYGNTYLPPWCYWAFCA